MKEKFEIIQEARLENLAKLLKFIEDACRQVDADQSISFDVKLAVEEACVNLIRHGYANMQPGPIRLTFQVEGQRIVINIGDDAPPFDPEQAPPPDLDPDWQKPKTAGLGWHLIRQVMDEIIYKSDPEKGNVLTLIKWLRPEKNALGEEE